MIERYTLPAMQAIWDLENRFKCMQEVEVAVALVQADLNIIPKQAAQDIAAKSKFSVPRIAEIEAETKHDVIAFVSNLAENVGDSGKYIHYGLTSSDVIDTATSLQIKKAGELVSQKIVDLKAALKKLILEHSSTLCSGRTHGMHAEPTTFGMKLLGFYVELSRNEQRFSAAIEQASIGKLSGAVGTYSVLDRDVEVNVCKALGLTPETVATQVIPRDRHAEVIYAISMLGAGLERLSVELRHLQRTEVAEVYEGFSKGQKGSSAMPHKKNPISAENLTGIARLLRGYLVAAHENIALWHERDISHSSVERVIFPDAFILIHYALDRMTQVLGRLEVDKERMKKNMDGSNGHLFSSHVLLALIETGLSREDAYKIVQRNAHALQVGEHLRDKLLQDPEVSSRVNAQTLDQIFSGQRHIESIQKIIPRVLG
ncbi:MAG: adenylosuccinate lyase [Bdellovibrionaceae bacterium]|nr:adenylosuccinate lyase [Pseudobdellovibrionaceae bacterium]